MKRCGRCGAIYESVAQLPSMTRFSGAELAQHVSHWPYNLIVEVRQCTRCDSPIACLAPAVSG